ncbi:hypothetical protein BRADI_3g22770v3 [Brachypodium distachyon]|uniref:TFIIS N-terminal domain-containing protein n=1 Tax=Brachypodium distachyon TaxID=15368 RepID=I1I3G4_BRADI|nr:hypothetical protein BRADI_3g22770v3 [Brachypodium distachyon]
MAGAGETSPIGWRKLFCSLGGDEILEAIKDAIAVAARDHPQELEQGRDSIVQMLQLPQSARSKQKGSEIPDEASASLLLQVSEQVAKIGSVLVGEEEDEAVVMESLRALEGVRMTFETLEATKIGRVVGRLRKKNSSENVRRLAGDICKGWMGLAEEHFRSCRRASPTSTTSTDGVVQEDPKTETADLETTPKPKIAGQVRGLQPKPRSSSSCEHKIEPTSSVDEELMLVTAKRKLISGYQRAATAKKQKRVQLIIAPERMMQPQVHRVVRRQ